jgi:hypothetical protein
MTFINFFLCFVGQFSNFLDSDPDCEFGSGSKGPTESGSNPDPDRGPGFTTGPIKGTWLLSHTMIQIILPLVTVCWRQPGDGTGTYRGNDKENCSIESRVAVWPTSWSMFISYKLLKLSIESVSQGSEIRNNLFAPGSIFLKVFEIFAEKWKSTLSNSSLITRMDTVLPGKNLKSLVTGPFRILFFTINRHFILA